MPRAGAAVLLFAAIAWPTRAEPPLARFARSEPHMGVEFEAIIYAADAKDAAAALTKAMQRVADLDKKLSDYDLDSELSKFSATSQARPGVKLPFPRVQLSDDLWTVLAAAQAMSEATGGAFDATIGPLTKLWRRARRWKELPDADALTAARSAVGYQHLQLDSKDHSGQLSRPNMRLDLGGIAKGFAADEALKVLQQCGFDRAVVRASGDIAAGQPPPGESGWRIGVAPLNPQDPPKQFLSLANCAVSTSGDARQHLVVNGRRYSHIIDPRTGDPVAGRSSVTVVAPNGILADALATAASVLGHEKALELIQRSPDAELFMVVEDAAGELQIVESDGFSKIKE